MQSIGFKNFRRFENLDPIELSGITFFVGGNNAGKSTVVKAMMLMLDNMSSRSIILDNPSFFLDANRIHEVHIGTFGRALHKPYPEKKVFSLESVVNNYRICYTVSGDTESSQANGEIMKIEVENIENNVLYTFDFVEAEANIRFNTSVLKKYGSRKEDLRQAFVSHPKLLSDQEVLENLRAEIKRKKDELDRTDDIVKSARLNNDIEKLENQIKNYENRFDPFEGKLKPRDESFSFNLEEFAFRSGDTFVSALLNSVSDRWDMLDYDTDFAESELIAESESIDQETMWLINKINKTSSNMAASDALALDIAIESNGIEYISAHAATQKVLFSIEDKNDYMAGVIRDFMQCRISLGSEEDLFVQRWMKNLNIGLDYDISPIEGEAYTMNIINMRGEKMPLADMGMGSIQMMILLLKLATIINLEKGDNCIVIVEEPEQNVHPKLQSELAKLFQEVHKDYHFRFVIETHSEYMIRKTQAMIATGEDGVSFENNPFRVYYFPENGEPYDMIYQPNGLFEEKFGEGFFDEASRLQFEVMKKARTSR